jgi:hypothetical protein
MIKDEGALTANKGFVTGEYRPGDAKGSITKESVTKVTKDTKDSVEKDGGHTSLRPFLFSLPL